MTFEPKICPCYSNTGIARLRSDHQVWYYDYVTTQVKQHPRLLHASTQHTLSPCLLHGSRTALALALALLLAVATLALATLGLRAGAPGHLVSPPLSLPLVSPRHCVPLTCITTSTILIMLFDKEERRKERYTQRERKSKRERERERDQVLVLPVVLSNHSPKSHP